MKRIMGFSFNRATRTVMAYDVRTWLQNIKLAHTFEAYHLSGNIRKSDVTIDGLFFSSWSLWVQTPLGMFGKGDLLQWAGFADLGLAELGFAISVAIVSDGTCVALFITLQKTVGNDLRKRHGAVTVVRVTDMVGVVPYTSENELVSPMLIAS